MHDGHSSLRLRPDVVRLRALGRRRALLEVRGPSLALRTTTNRSHPIHVAGLHSRVTAVSTGGRHTCAVVNGGLQCWGKNDYGQLGNDTKSDSTIPVPVVFSLLGVRGQRLEELAAYIRPRAHRHRRTAHRGPEGAHAARTAAVRTRLWRQAPHHALEGGGAMDPGEGGVPPDR